MQKKEYSIEIGGKTLTALFTDLADQASGSVILRYGETTVLVTAVMGGDRDGLDYFPLSVEFEEKNYAAGAILGGRFQKREGRPSDEAILAARVIDRTIRPLFNHSIRRDVQVIVSVLSLGHEDPDVLGVIGASLSLAVSDIPWAGPVSAVRIGRKKEGDFLINPNYEERLPEVEILDMLACGKDSNINMIEVGSSEVKEDMLEEAMKKAVEIHNTLQDWQNLIISDIGKEKVEIQVRTVSDEIKELFKKEIEPKMAQYVFGDKGAYLLKEEWMKLFKEKIAEPDSKADAGDYFEEKIDELVHIEALEKDRRQDGRKMDEVRNIYAQAGGISPVIHGTGIFYRGGTHVLSALTLGGPGDAQLLNTIESQDGKKDYIHHYNFPPFSVGETGRVGGFNRRMIGHGALAEKALKPVIPTKDVFPYTIRIVSEVLASNGSSSQASVCGSTLALMDAGVPITRPVAGIAMGMMSNAEKTINQSTWDTKDYRILTDIQGPEDHFGDMDFKVAGTTEGVTAVQMDVKVSGVPVSVLSEAFAQAKTARLHILDIMHEAIPESRADINVYAPKIISMTIKQDQIGLVIGPGGKTVTKIREETGAEIDIEDNGTIYVTGKEGGAEAAITKIEALTHEYTAGELFTGEVTKIFDFGALVKIGGSTEGLVHVSEIAPFRIENVEDALSVGEMVPIVVKEVNKRENKISLSIKQADAKFAEKKGLKPAANTQKTNGDKPTFNKKPRG